MAAEFTRQIIASGQLYSTFLRDEKPLRFRIGHLSGPFARATFAARVAGDHAVGPDGQTTLDIDNGPPMTPRFEARFRHPTFTRGVPVGFEPGVPVSGGAGFCTTGRTGFVISAATRTLRTRSRWSCSTIVLAPPVPHSRERSQRHRRHSSGLLLARLRSAHHGGC